MEKNLDVDNVCTMFENAPKTLGDEKFGLAFIEKNGQEVVQSRSFRNLSASRLLTIVKSNRLDVVEDELWTAVAEWAQAECKRNGFDYPKPDHLKNVLSEVIPHIRFPLMKMATLSEVNSLGVLAPEQMLKLFTWVNSSEQDRDSKQMEWNCQPREAALPRFRFTELNADDGIIHWIGTREGKEDWTNPHTAGLVTVTASSWSQHLNPGNQLSHVVERQSSVSYGTNNESDSWICVELKDYAVVPDHYRFANTRTTNCMPRSWRFQGSKDGYDWVTLRQHASDYWNGPGNTVAAWPIEGVQEAFRFFRILQTGMTSEGNFGHLCCSGIEIWGRVRKLHSGKA
jgi:hypothetical protein